MGFIYKVNNFTLIPYKLLLYTTSNICVACTSDIDVSITIKQKANVSNGVGIAPNSLNIKFHHSAIYKKSKNTFLFIFRVLLHLHTHEKLNKC